MKPLACLTIAATMIFSVLPRCALAATFASRSLVCAVYGEKDGELGIDLGRVGEIDFSVRKVLAPPGTVEPGKFPNSPAWPLLRVGCWSANGVVGFMFAADRQGPAPAAPRDTLPANGFTNVDVGVRQVYSKGGGANPVLVEAGTLHSYVQAMNRMGTRPGNYGGINPDPATYREASLAPLAEGRAATLYLYRYTLDIEKAKAGTIVYSLDRGADSDTEYFATLGFAADGSILLNPEKGGTD